jgi:adenylate cyclase
VERSGGVVVKTICHEVMATFRTADAALGCAEAIVAGMRCTSLGSEKPLGVRVGFAFGPVVEDKKDVFGDTVNVAARMLELADNQRIFTTGDTAAQLDGSTRARLRLVETIEFKRREHPVEVFELTMGQETLIRFEDAPRSEEPGVDDLWLLISCRGKQHVLRGRRTSLTIGRDRSNDIVLDSPSASRFHARIERRRRAFYLVDRSSNGTTVISDSGRTATLRKEDLRIIGSGTFGAGGSRDARPEEPIHFEVRGRRDTPKSNSITGW